MNEYHINRNLLYRPTITDFAKLLFCFRIVLIIHNKRIVSKEMKMMDTTPFFSEKHQISVLSLPQLLSILQQLFMYQKM